MSISIRRLRESGSDEASLVSRVIARTFGEGEGASPERLRQLLVNDNFWIYGAFDDAMPIGGITAHVIPMTHSPGEELFIYDVAVQRSHQRQGVGTKLMAAVLQAAGERGLLSVFVPADNDDGHALEFYKAIGGESQHVTFFNFEVERRSNP
jgi:aminoglycoside 3-N-acetyltransferase I